jgi:hypothetical protein
MTSFKLFGAALILSTAFATPVFARSASGLPVAPYYNFYWLDNWVFDDWAFLSPHKGPEGPRAAMTVQPGRVLDAQVRRPVRPQRARISTTGTR